MIFHIITLFPDAFDSYFDSSILKIAKVKQIFKPIFYKLSDFSIKKTKRVDDRPYGGMPGTILSIEPIYKAINYIENKYGKLDKIYLSARGKILNQNKFEKFAKIQKDLIVICGHYEGIDQRIMDLFNIKEFSIGKYVITSGELATMVFIDGIIRLLPGVINNKSLEEESFNKKLLNKKEYPQYTRPEIFMGYRVPKELLSGDPSIINKWKKIN